MTDYDADVQQMLSHIGYYNSWWYNIWIKFADPMAWDGQSCSEIACCISYMAGNLSKIYVSNYAQGLYNLFDSANRISSVPIVGAFIFFSSDGVTPDHTGRVIEFTATHVHTFEGNVGGTTVDRWWSLSDPYIFAYGHPNYTNEQLDTYTVRDKSPEGESLPEYNTTGSGGWNSNSTGNGAVTGANVLYDTYGYAQGRLIEIYNQVHSADTFQIDNKTPTSWVQGGIGSTGQNTGVTTRCRTGFINFNGYQKIVITYPSGFRGYAFEYSTNNQNSFIQRFPASGWIPTNSSRTILIKPSCYYRFLIAKTDNTNITPAEALASGFSIMAYSGNQPITNADENLFKLFTSSVADWSTLAPDYGYSLVTAPDLGCIGIWYSANVDAYHIATVESFQNNKWYVSESYRSGPTPSGSWDITYLLGSSDDYRPYTLSQDYALISFVKMIDVTYPPMGALPPSLPANFKYVPYYRHMRRLRGD